jgi:hypothetical protein
MDDIFQAPSMALVNNLLFPSLLLAQALPWRSLNMAIGW